MSQTRHAMGPPERLIYDPSPHVSVLVKSPQNKAHLSQFAAALQQTITGQEEGFIPAGLGVALPSAGFARIICRGVRRSSRRPLRGIPIPGWVKPLLLVPKSVVTKNLEFSNVNRALKGWVTRRDCGQG